MVATIWPADHLILGVESKLNFLGHGSVAFQINENHKCSNMVANILPQTPSTDPWGQRSKFRSQILKMYR